MAGGFESSSMIQSHQAVNALQACVTVSAFLKNEAGWGSDVITGRLGVVPFWIAMLYL